MHGFAYGFPVATIPPGLGSSPPPLMTEPFSTLLLSRLLEAVTQDPPHCREKEGAPFLDRIGALGVVGDKLLRS